MAHYRSENTASPSTGAAPAPDGPPGPAPAATPSDLPKHPGHIDAEKALAKWQAIAADESLPAHKREAANFEVLRYRRQVQSWDSMPPPPILVFEGEPPKRDPVALPERWPPPPRLIIVDTPPAWGRPELHHWLGQQGLQLHRSDEIRYRRPTRHPAILSVVRKPDATGDDFVARSSQSAGGPGDHGIAPENPLDLAQAFHGEAARTKTGGSS